MEKYDVYGVGNALMDIQVFVPEKFLKKLKIPKGIMHLIEEKKSKEILNEIINFKNTSMPGGSCTNTISTIAMLGGKAAYTGIVCDDFYGRLYDSKLNQRKVKSLIRMRNEGLTGTSIIFTTEDAERTMNTHLGICRDLSEDDIDFDIMSNSKIFHCTGYELDTLSQKKVIKKIMDFAKSRSMEISFDIADPFCIERNFEEIKAIIKNYVTILFGNKDEAKMLSGKDDPVEAGKTIMKMGPKIAIVKDGCKGSYIFNKDKFEHIDIFKAKEILDSTGCGDVYGGGFLYGYTRNYPLKKSAQIASYLAAEIISVPGVQLELLNFNEINKFIENNILNAE